MSKIAAVQAQDIQGDITATLRVIQHWMARAEDEGVDVLCFPECFLQGYTLDKDETKQRALGLKSIQFQNILRELKDYNVTTILGLIEKDGDRLYNTAAVIHKGMLLGKYRKVHLFEPNFTPGDEYPVFEVSGIKFGINICYDARFAEGAEALAKQGAQVIFYPLNNRLPIEKANKYRDKHVPNLVERTKETGCWIVSSDVIAQDSTHIGYGCTAIVNPRGEVVSKMQELEVSMVIDEIA